MNNIAAVKAALADIGFGRVKVIGNSIALPKRAFSLDVQRDLERKGWIEESYRTAYGGFSCEIRMSKDGIDITISDYHDKCSVYVK